MISVDIKAVRFALRMVNGYEATFIFESTSSVLQRAFGLPFLVNCTDFTTASCLVCVNQNVGIPVNSPEETGMRSQQSLVPPQQEANTS